MSLSRLHCSLAQRSSAYRRWHGHPLHPHAHWGLLGAVVLGVALSFVILGWSEVEIVPAQLAQAQTSLAGADGKTIEQRKAEWLARFSGSSPGDSGFYDGASAWKLHPHEGRNYLLAWAEKGTHGDNVCRSTGALQTAYANDSNKGCINDERIVPQNLCFGINSWVEYEPENNIYNDLNCIEGNLRGLSRTRASSGSVSLDTLNRLCHTYGRQTACQYLEDQALNHWEWSFYPNDSERVQPQATLNKYLYAEGNPEARLTWCPGGADPFSCVQWDYQGRTYTPGTSYNVYQFSRDYFFKLYENWKGQSVREFDSSYSGIGFNAVSLLADLAADPAMKQRAKMMYDLYALDHVAGFSAGNNSQYFNSRTYRSDFIGGWGNFPYYSLWGHRGPNDDYAYPLSTAYVSPSRLPAVIQDIGVLNQDIDVLNDEGTGYYHVTKENYYRRYSFINNDFNLASSVQSRAWMANIRSNNSSAGTPLLFGISSTPGSLDMDFCPPGECYPDSGGAFSQEGYQYLNAIYVRVDSPILHLSMAGPFDSGSDALNPVTQTYLSPSDNTQKVPKNDYQLGSKQIFFEGNVGIAIVRSGSEIGVELGIVNGSCTAIHCYASPDAFRNASRSIGGGSFTTGKGNRIENRSGVTYVNNSAYNTGSFPRLEMIDNNNTPIVSWNGNTMVVSRHGRTCNYDFNNWTTNGDCGGTSTPPPKTCTTPTCTTSAGCAGTCSADQTYCVDVANDNCPAASAPGPTPGPVCGNDQCEADETSSSCPVDCGTGGGGGSCPTTCMIMGGDTCSDSLANATELPACSTAYCAPNYSPKRYCVKCNPGATLVNDRCVASGGAGSNAPRAPALTYCGLSAASCGNSPPVCPNGTCESGETSASCPQDCPATPPAGQACGNGTIDAGESCDGANLSSQTCQSLGFSGGTPACTAQCTLDTSNCTTSLPQCADGIDNADPEDTLIDMNDRGCSSASDNSEVDPGTSQGSFNHTFPRIFAFYWGGATADWDARFDVTMDHGSLSQGAKALNPQHRVLPTADWNRCDDYLGPGCSSTGGNAWTVLTSSRQPIVYWGGLLSDPTDLSPLSLGERYNDRRPRWVQENGFTPGVHDGVSTDGFWERPNSISDIDLDRNGANDYTERGSSWVESRWVEGTTRLLQNLRAQLGTGVPILINTGGFPDVWWEEVNGFNLEKSWCIQFGWEWCYNRYRGWAGVAPQPHVFLIDGNAEMDRKYAPAISKNHFSLMRYALATSLVWGTYVDFTDKEAGEHFYVKYYDEYDLDLGMPTSEPTKLARGIWARCYEKGASVVNPSGRTASVSAADITGILGCASRYYRFLGGQDPGVNTGQQFSSTSLFSEYYHDCSDAIDNDGDGLIDGTDAGCRDTPGPGTPPEDRNEASGDLDGGVTQVGDGLILVSEANLPVIADIIVDTEGPETSPASNPASLSGSWNKSQEVCTNPSAHPSWGVGPGWCGTWGGVELGNRYRWAPAGAGSSQATFQPTIGAVGRYEVFEWHGWHGLNGGDFQEASNAPYEIRHRDGTAAGTIDQTRNYGQWNPLGTFYFTRGNSGLVRITNNANGFVLADAFLFRYVGP